MSIAITIFSVMFRLAVIGMMYGIYSIVKQCWRAFIIFDEYQYDDYENDDREYLCECGEWVAEEEMTKIHGRWVCDYCVF